MRLYLMSWYFYTRTRKSILAKNELKDAVLLICGEGKVSKCLFTPLHGGYNYMFYSLCNRVVMRFAL